MPEPMRDFEDYAWRDLVDDEIRHIYSPYVRDRSVGRDPALVVVHPERAVPGPWHDAATRLAAAFRQRGRPVVHSIPPGVAPAIAVGDADLRCARPCESAFFSSDLERTLTRAGAGALVVCGAATSGPLRATVVEGKSFGYRVALAEETVGDLTPLLHKMALFDIAHKYADVMTLEELLAQPALHRESPAA